MKEFVTANDRIFECMDVKTKPGYITLIIENVTANEMTTFFSDVKELTTHFEKENGSLSDDLGLLLEDPHGFYKNLELEFVGTNVNDGSVSVRMRMKTEIEIRIEALEEGQRVQNGAISDLGKMVGGEA